MRAAPPPLPYLAAATDLADTTCQPLYELASLGSVCLCRPWEKDSHEGILTLLSAFFCILPPTWHFLCLYCLYSRAYALADGARAFTGVVAFRRLPRTSM